MIGPPSPIVGLREDKRRRRVPYKGEGDMEYILMMVAIIALGLAASFLVCLASVFWIGSACGICRLFQDWLHKPKAEV